MAENCATLTAKYPHLITGEDASVPLVIGSDGTVVTTAVPDFASFRKQIYGTDAFTPATLSLNVHDRGSAPAFLPLDVSQLIASTLSSFAAANSKTPLSTAIMLQTFLQARFRNVADLSLAIVPHHQVDGRQVYYYYPRVSFDFGSVFTSASTLDRFDFLALRLTLKGCPAGPPRVRIVDYYPKASDFAEYTRGQLTEGAQLQAQLAYTATKGVSAITGATPDTTTSTRSTTLGPQVGGSVSDSYVAQIVDAIDRRTSAVLDDGAMFYADFRGTRQVRVGGTYNFDVMLEVPSQLQPTDTAPCADPSATCVSNPIATNVNADATLIGMVRHVYRRGQIGRVTRVPEPENDDVFEEVVLKRIPDIALWQFNASPAVSNTTSVLNCVLAVTTNRDDAEFVANDAQGALLGRGSGREAAITYSSPAGKACATPTLSFLPILTAGDKGSTTILRASIAIAGKVAISDGVVSAVIPLANGNASVVASYAPVQP
jgi:hypothetical protein